MRPKMVRFAFLIMAGLATAQAPRIGIIEFYGLHKVPEAKIRQALQAREGDPLPPSKGDRRYIAPGPGRLIASLILNLAA